MSKHIALVTGANKGIGLEIVRCLCRHLGEDGIVYLTARDEGRGKAAVAQLQKEGLSPLFHALDVTKKESIERLRDHLKKTHGGCDVLVNNAGLGLTYGPTWTFSEKATAIMTCNFFGVLDVSRALMPLIRSGGRIVNVASTAAYFQFLYLKEDLKTRFREASSEQDIISIMEEYVTAVQNGKATECPYSMSKICVVTLTALQSREIKQDRSRHGILINSCCPGFVKTDMSAKFPDISDQWGRKLSVSEGADTPVYLVTLPPGAQHPQGQFLLRRQVYDFIHNDVEISPTAK